MVDAEDWWDMSAIVSGSKANSNKPQTQFLLVTNQWKGRKDFEIHGNSEANLIERLSSEEKL
jgi:hypothetical protein